MGKRKREDTSRHPGLPSYEDADAGRYPGTEYAGPWWDAERETWYGPNGDVPGPDGRYVKAQIDKLRKTYNLRGFWDPAIGDSYQSPRVSTRKQASYDADLLTDYAGANELLQRDLEIVACLDRGLTPYATAKLLGMTTGNMSRSLKRLMKAARAWSAR